MDHIPGSTPWDRVQERLRRSRGRIEGPSPAHDFLMASEGEHIIDWYNRITNKTYPRMVDGRVTCPLGLPILDLLNAATSLEGLFEESGSAWVDRKVDEALEFALSLSCQMLS